MLVVLYWLDFSPSLGNKLTGMGVKASPPTPVCMRLIRIEWMRVIENLHKHYFSFVHFRIPALTNLNRFSSQCTQACMHVERNVCLCCSESRAKARKVEFRSVAFCLYPNVQVLIKRCIDNLKFAIFSLIRATHSIKKFILILASLSEKDFLKKWIYPSKTIKRKTSSKKRMNADNSTAYTWESFQQRKKLWTVLCRCRKK